LAYNYSELEPASAQLTAAINQPRIESDLDEKNGSFGRTVAQIIADNNETVKRRRKQPGSTE